MDSFHQLDEYSNRLKRATQSLDKMQVKIATMKGNQAIPFAKRKENETAYFALVDYVKVSDRAINTLIDGNKKLEQEQSLKWYAKGAKDERESAMGGIPEKYWDKEAYRAWHELQTKNKWSDLY